MTGGIKYGQSEIMQVMIIIITTIVVTVVGTLLTLVKHLTPNDL
jgi:uncharacterized membrane protein